jgi:hypothetical protein
MPIRAILETTRSTGGGRSAGETSFPRGGLSREPKSASCFWSRKLDHRNAGVARSTGGCLPVGSPGRPQRCSLPPRVGPHPQERTNAGVQILRLVSRRRNGRNDVVAMSGMTSRHSRRPAPRRRGGRLRPPSAGADSQQNHRLGARPPTTPSTARQSNCRRASPGAGYERTLDSPGDGVARC